MGLITGQKNVTARVTYFISFNFEGATFKSEGIKHPVDALRVSMAIKYLGSKNGESSPNIERLVEYLDNGRYECQPEHDNIAIEELEKIVSENLSLTKRFNIVESKY